MINIPKGTNDILPSQSYIWQELEKKVRDAAKLFNAHEIRTPIFEHTELFSRGAGDFTDVVTKEMYTFLDKGGRSLTLKAEGTAPVVRSLIENGLDSQGLPQKLFYLSDIFRYERPQAGRMRQHKQFGVEFFGSTLPEMDAEVIGFAHYFFNSLGISELKLHINNIGCAKCRPSFNQLLQEYFEPKINEMCADCKVRLYKNPLRLLDCKCPQCKEAAIDAPKIGEHTCSDCVNHFNQLLELLNGLDIPYIVDNNLVRGFDYYTRTVFEFVTNKLGAQNTICGGGRYDGLVAQLGGKQIAAVGFGMGIERLLLLANELEIALAVAPQIKLYIAPINEDERKRAHMLAFYMRRLGVSTDCDQSGRSLKAQFKYADRIGAQYVLVYSSQMLESGTANLKEMQSGKEREVDLNELKSALIQKT